MTKLFFGLFSFFVISIATQAKDLPTKTCQFLLSPTELQFKDYLTQLIEENPKRLDENAVRLDVSQTILRSPLRFFYSFHADFFSSPKENTAVDWFQVPRFQIHKIFRKAFGQAIYQHSAGFSERASILKKIVGHSGDFIDELIGLNREALETEESISLQESKSNDDRLLDVSHFSGIGLAAGHGFWFSSHPLLLREVTMARSLWSQN